ncbi:RHNO1 protein, partial [Alcedo cyanopectus]|nr:RHNO1 protein [Ceyx cyanopectus]
MPRKQKGSRQARRRELVFLESPREGPQRCHSPPPAARNPRRVPARAVEHSTPAAWVCPAFEAVESGEWKACQEKHRRPHKTQNQEASHGSLHAGVCQKPRSCRFPSLTFEHSGGCADNPSAFPRSKTRCSQSQPNTGVVPKHSFQVSSPENCGEMLFLPAPLPEEPEVFSPPDVDTPPVPSLRQLRCSSTPPWRSIHPCQTGELAALAADTPEHEFGLKAALAADTPEHEYGLKVTWRQRPQLMRFLQERG